MSFYSHFKNQILHYLQYTLVSKSNTYSQENEYSQKLWAGKFMRQCESRIITFKM